jgi:hypothetical protein
LRYETWRILNMATDLEQLFGYQDVVDSSSDLEIIGNELLVLPCWKAEFCSVIIRATHAAGCFSPSAGDPVPGHEVSLALISPRLFENIQNDFGVRIWPQLQKHWPLIDYHGIQDIFVIKYEVGQQEELRLHHDIAQVSASIKLNDDYEGAELEFPRQKYSNKNLRVGQMLAWPSLVTHPHRSLPITRGVKYSATVWFELPIVNS